MVLGETLTFDIEIGNRQVLISRWRVGCIFVELEWVC